MDEEGYQELIEFLEKATLLAADLERRCKDAAEQQQGSAMALAQVLHLVEANVKEVATAGKDELAQHAQTAVRQVLAQEIGGAAQSLDESAGRLRQLANQLQHEQSTIGMQMRILAWKSLLSIGAAAALALLGTGFVLWQNIQRIQRSNVDAEVMEALQHVTITSCDGRPCLKLAEGQPRWTKNKDYVLVDTSASTAAAPTPKSNRVK
jgi:hypothetical protein